MNPSTFFEGGHHQGKVRSSTSLFDPQVGQFLIAGLLTVRKVDPEIPTPGPEVDETEIPFFIGYDAGQFRSDP